MNRLRNGFFAKNEIIQNTSRWDLLALSLVLAVIIALAWSGQQMAQPFVVGEHIKINLAPSALPKYALLTVSRLMIAMVFSLLFTFIFGTWAAKSKHAEKIIIPAIDILQSVPVIGFLSITVMGFIALFPHSRLGPECAAIFVIFTSQAWNMALGFYQSLITVPNDLKEACHMFQLSAWQKFWRVEVAFAMPSLLWNMMMSMSASWFFVTISESISIHHNTISLPGIGSYIGEAILQANKPAIAYAIMTMLIVIVLYDQLIFRPLSYATEKFHAEQSDEEEIALPIFVRLLQRSQIMHAVGAGLRVVLDKWVNNRFTRPKLRLPRTNSSAKSHMIFGLLWYVILAGVLLFGAYLLWHFIFKTLSLAEAGHVIVLGMFTALRVLILIIICSLIWVPIGVWIGLRPKIANIVQPIAQVLAAFPANLLFPIVVMLVVKYQLNVEIWLTPLMILGTQWYILFNVIAGTLALPKDLKFAAKNFNVRGWLWWQRLILPAIFPYFITGALTATGGAWNASIVAEAVNWGHTTLTATGLGAYINYYSQRLDYPRIALGITVMCLFVLLFNRLIWRPLYVLAEEKFQVN